MATAQRVSRAITTLLNNQGLKSLDYGDSDEEAITKEDDDDDNEEDDDDDDGEEVSDDNDDDEGADFAGIAGTFA